MKIEIKAGFIPNIKVSLLCFSLPLFAVIISRDIAKSLLYGLIPASFVMIIANLFLLLQIRKIILSEDILFFYNIFGKVEKMNIIDIGKVYNVRNGITFTDCKTNAYYTITIVSKKNGILIDEMLKEITRKRQKINNNIGKLRVYYHDNSSEEI